MTSSCQSDCGTGFKQHPLYTQGDIKPCYSLQTYPDHSNSRSSDYTPTPYYSGAPKPTIKPTKILHKEDSDKPTNKLIPKTESSTPSSPCFNLVPTKTEILVKPELTSAGSCRSNTTPPPPPLRQPTYDSYLNHDSNSSSVSSMDTMGSHHQHHQLHPPSHLPVPPPPVAPHHLHPPPPAYTSMSLVEDSRNIHRSPYDGNSVVPTNASDDIYRSDHPTRTYSINNNSNLNRPVVSYPTDIASRGYEITGQRPYDPGSTNAAYERYETASQQCQQAQRYAEYQDHEMRNYDPQQHHQIPPQGIMKQDQSTENENSEAPIYPRYNLDYLFK